MNYYDQIKGLLISNEVYKTVKVYSKNKHDLDTYYNIGRILIEAQGGETRAKYGNKLIKEYSTRLYEDLNKKYSTTSLKYMRQFYLYIKGQPVADQLTWSHYIELMSIKDINKRNYYIQVTINEKLSRNNLRKRIKTKEYERLSRDTKEKLINHAKLELIDTVPNPIIIPNTYNEVNNNIKESYLKQLILENLDKFLKQLGNGYCYVGNEYQIMLDKRFYYIDLLLFNIEFNSYVVIELKINELKKKDIGQIKFYINYIDKNIKNINQNNTIGIILCKKGNDLILEYSSVERIHSREYKIINI